MYSDNKNVAIFIDAENISSKYAKDIFEYASSYGNVIIKRIYADWSKQNVISWKDEIFNYSITAMQQFSSNSNKNSSDMYLATEALSIFYEKEIDVFIIVSSDSDYTSLVQKLRENKKTLIGIGLNKSSAKYTNSFNEFLYLDKKTDDDKNTTFESIPKEQVNHLIKVIKELLEEKGRAEYSTISSKMLQKYSDFNAKNYGFSSFRKLMENFLETEQGSNYKQVLNEDKSTYYLIKKYDKNTLSDILEEQMSYLVEVIEEILDKKDKVSYVIIGKKFRQEYKDFDCKDYGFNSFTEFIENFLDTKQGEYYKQVPNKDNRTYSLVKKETLLLNP